MTSAPHTRIDPGSFDAAYSAAEDPWGFETSGYELGRYAATIDALSKERYRRCFEPACSVGVLTGMLARRADEIVACDGSSRAVECARQRLAGNSRVDVHAAAIPEWWPDGTFDLIVLSELGYYWDRSGWADVVDRSAASLDDGGEIVAVHWLGLSPDHVQHGRSVHESLQARFGRPDLHLERLGPPGTPQADGFVLDRWSVAP